MLFQQGEHPTWKSWDLTNLTQKWVKTPSSNHGVILWATNDDVNSYDLRFYSSEHENKPPQLMIIWSNQPKTVYFLKDHLGSIRATVLDSAGAPVIAYDDYDPWGHILSGRTKKRTWSDNQAVARNKFTGKEWDDDYSVNWLHFPYRSYDPEIARWLVRDPLEMKYPNLSPYVYTLDNPVKFVDIKGLHVKLAKSSPYRLVGVGYTYIGDKRVGQGYTILNQGESTKDKRILEGDLDFFAYIDEDEKVVTLPNGATWFKVSASDVVDVEFTGDENFVLSNLKSKALEKLPKIETREADEDEEKNSNDTKKEQEDGTRVKTHLMLEDLFEKVKEFQKRMEQLQEELREQQERKRQQEGE